MSQTHLIRRLFSAVTLSLALGLSACNGAADAGSGPGAVSAAFPASDGQSGPLAQRSYKTDVLLYDGVAAAFYDGDALEEIARSNGLTVDRVSSSELNNMSLDQISGYGMILWPGGYATEQSDSLTGATRTRLRTAVIERGVSFMGICAGAWMGIGPVPASGKDSPWGLAIVPGAIMDEYFPSGQDGFEMTPVTVAGESKPRDMVWWGGPAIPEWKDGVVARYKDGTPAIGQTWAGHGFVVLSSPHPEAPQIWRDQHSVTDSDGLDWDLAFKLMKATLDQKPLPTL